MAITRRRSLTRIAVAFLAITIVAPQGSPPPAVRAAARAPEPAVTGGPTYAPGSVRSASSAATPTITSIVLDTPAGTTTNDVLLAAITLRGTASITAPSGWTLVRSDANGSTLTQAVYVRVAGGSEPASDTWTFGAPIEGAVGSLIAYSGVDTTTPVDVSGGQANASSTSVTAPSVTTTVANAQVVGFFGTGNDATFSPPAGMSERTDVLANTTMDVSGESADVAQASAGASGSKTATASKAAVNVGQLVALRPSGTIALRAATTAAIAPITSLTIATPAGTAADDVLLVAIAERNDQQVYAPAGWHPVRVDLNGTSLLQAIFVRTALSSEPSSHTFTFDDPIRSATGGIVAFADIDPAQPIDTHAGQANASSTSVSAPSIPTSVADTVLVGFFATADDRTFSPPTGMTERFDQLLDSSADVASSAASVSQSPAGASGTKVATASGAAVNIGALVALRPKDAPSGLGFGSQRSVESWDLGSGDGLAVDVATRNALVSHPILSLPIRGSSVSLSLTYNAKDPANLGLGPGWRLNLQRRLRLNDDGTVTFTDPSGARHRFTNPQTNGSVTTYTRPATLYATLTKDTSQGIEFRLVYRDQSLDTFDIAGVDGLLIREEDRFGNGVTLAYESGTTNIATVTDDAADPDRVISFEWSTASEPDRLTEITDWAWISNGVVQTSATGAKRDYRFFHDAKTGRLTGWADPLDASGACPTAASHRTCLGYTAAGLLALIAKTQTYTTLTSGTFGSSTRTITTEIAYAGSEVATMTDAEEQSQGTPERTTFTAESATDLRVDRPTTTTTYGLVAAGDPYGRVASVWRTLDGSTEIERRTTWDATYPIEPASITDNYGALLSTPARTTAYTYVASSMGLLAKIVEPLTATDDRWTEFTYNANNDVLTQTVSLEGSSSERTITKSCYSSDCTTNTGLTLLKRIDNFVSGGATDEDTNVATEFSYDSHGQLTRETRHNKAPDGSARDDRQTGFTYDDQGNLTAEIANYANGTVTLGTDDVAPNATTGARTDLTTIHTYDTAGNRVSSADPRRAIALAATTYAADTFNRSVTDGWGTADTGGSWSSTTADHDVTGSVGTISLSSNTNRNAYLTSVSAQDQEVLVKVNVDRLAVGSAHLFWVYLRRQDSSTYYQARLSFNTSGAIVAHFSRFSGGSTTVIDSGTTQSVHTTTDWYWLRARISGTTSVRGQIKVWTDGSTEPVAWEVDGTDASPPAGLQGTGHVGIRFQLGGSYSGAYPVVASVDDFAVTSFGGGLLAPDDFINRTTYDPLNQPVSQTTPTTPGLATAQKTTTTTYDELGQVRSATDYGGLVAATLYDRAGRATKTYEDPPPAGSAYQTSATTYDADGRVLSATDRRQLVDATLGATTFAYDGLGRQTAMIEAAGSSPDIAAETRTTYDGLDRVASSEVGYGSAASLLTAYAYDLGGRTIETDDGFTCATATYDYRDLALTRTDGLAGGTCGSGAASRTLTTTYDGLGRATRAEVTSGADSGDRPFEATLDGAGNALTIAVKKSGATTTTTRTVNLLDEVLAEARADGSTVKTTYDPVGNPIDRCFWAPSASVGDCLPVGTTPWTDPPTSSTSSTWDARGGRIGLADSATNQTTVYDPDHNYQPAAVYTPTGTDGTKEHQSLFAYDAEHRLVTLTHQLCTVSSGHACSSTTSTGGTTYAYDDNANRTRVDESNGSASSDRRYCYDARNQLTYRNTAAACSAGANDEAYTYDAAGHRLTAAGRSFSYSSSGQVTSCSSPSCTASYDSAGRTATLTDNGTSWTYGYDAAGRLVTACKSTACGGSVDTVAFSYDGEGHRTKIVATPAAGSPVTTTEFRYHGDAVVAEVVNGTVVREFVTNDAGMIQKVIVPSGQTDAGTYLVVWNGHGDATGLWRMNGDGTLTLANSYTYATWGAPTTATHNSISDLGFRYLYVGAWDVQWDDQFGLDLLYMHARHYHPALGRFLQPDPARADANPYGYAGNSPISKVDPSGEIAWFVLLVPIASAVIRSVAIRALPWAVQALSTVVAAGPKIQSGLQHVNDRHAWPIGVQFTTNLTRLRNLFPDVSKFFPMSNTQWERIIRGAENARVVSREWTWHWWPPGFTWKITLEQTFSTAVGYDARSNVITRTVTYFIENGWITSFRPGPR